MLIKLIVSNFIYRGQWVDYNDKKGRGIFYYNKVVTYLHTNYSLFMYAFIN